MYMAKIREVLHAIDGNSGPAYDAEPLEKIHTDDDYNVFATEKQYSEQPESIYNTYVVETPDSNINPDSTDMCDNEIKDDQNVEEPEDEHVLQVVSAAKLPILNPNEFDLWKMRIEQYFLMTDYSLWEVILNGDSPAPTRVIDGVLQPVAPTTAKQRLARKNELKAHGTLLMALPDKCQLKFNTHNDAKTLMEAIEKRFRGNTKTKKVQKTLLKQQYKNFTGSSSESLDQIHDSLPTGWRTHTLIWRNKTDLEEQSLNDLFNSLKIYEAEVKSSSSASTTTQNIAFVSSSNTDITNKSVSDASSVSAIDADDLEEMDLKWKMAMLTVRARRFLQMTERNLGANGPTSMGFDMFKVECYNCHRKGHFARECRSLKDTRRNSAAEPQKRNEEPTNYALMAFFSLSSSSDNELRDNVVVVLRQNLEKAEQERDDLKLKLEKFQTSSKNLSELLASQTNDKTCLGYNSQVFTRAIVDCYDYLSSGSDESSPPSPIYDRYQSGNGYHDVSSPYSGTFMPPKPDLVFNNAPNDVETDHSAFTVKLPTEEVKSPRSYVQHVETSIPTANFKTTIPKPTSNGKRRNHAKRGNHKQYAQMTLSYPQRHVVPTTVVPKSKLVPINAARPVTTAVPKIKVTRPRQDKPIVTKPNSPPRRLINHSPSPKANTFSPKVTVVKAPMVNVAKNFEELNGGYVSFGGNPKGGKICGKDENQVMLRVPRENNMYNVNLKNIVPSGDLTCLFAKATLDESTLWHRRLGHINFKIMNKLVKGNLVRGLPYKIFENDNTRVACKKGKQHRASCKTKPVSSVNQPYTDDYSRFTWVFFLATKDETSPILKTFITCLENQLSLTVKVIRSDNETEFKNNDLNQFCGMKGIKREFSVPRTPQQNGIAERKNMTLIEAARTMLADSLLPIPF
nr:hypothetical protein [Tanacetum cinerariifolium]